MVQKLQESVRQRPETKKERPIIFGSESIRQILSSIKTQTRRAIKGVPDNARHGEFAAPFGEEHKGWAGGVFFEGANVNSPGVGSVRCPYGKPGDRLWVREGWCTDDVEAEIPVFADYALSVQYKADPENYHGRFVGVDKTTFEKYAHENFNGDWRSPLFMPRWASRLTLTITDVRVERLQDITKEEVIAEGIVETRHDQWWADPKSDTYHYDPISAYAEIWERLNAKRGYPWKSNPFCWVISFRRLP